MPQTPSQIDIRYGVPVCSVEFLHAVGRLQVARVQFRREGCVDSLTGCRRAGWDHGPPPTGCGSSSREFATHQSKLGAGMRPLGKKWNAVRPDTEWDCRKFMFPERIRTHPITETWPVEAGASRYGPSDNRDRPALPTCGDRLGENATGDLRGNPAGRRQRDRFASRSPEPQTLSDSAGGIPQPRDRAPVGRVPTMPPPRVRTRRMARGEIDVRAVRDSVKESSLRNGNSEDTAAVESTLHSNAQEKVATVGSPSSDVDTRQTLVRGSPKRPPSSCVAADPAKRPMRTDGPLDVVASPGNSPAPGCADC